MDDVARFSPNDRADLFRATAGNRGFNPVIAEKDFWVCWTLKRLFTLPDEPAGLVFKGGTSLSKAYRAIERFSEDVDLSFDRSDLGFGGDADPSNAASKSKQQDQIEMLREACAEMIRDALLPRLQASIEQQLGADGWRLELDAEEQDGQTVNFHFPQSGLTSGSTAAYLRPFIRLEMGARGEPWPSELVAIQSFAAEDFPATFTDPACKVKVIAAERTFWEKATILHMWHHAAREKPMGERQARHYYDVVKLYQSAVGERALADLGLLRSVAAHKSVFFARAWAKFDEAVPGTLRLVPPGDRLAEVGRDYERMRVEMIYGESPALEEVVAILGELEARVNEAS